MSTNTMSIVKKILLPFLMLGTICVLGITALLHTQAGLDLSLKIVKSVFPGELTYKEATGAHNKLITITDIQIKNKNFEGTIKNLKIKWEPLALLSRTLAIDDLMIDQIKITPIFHNTSDKNIQFKISKLNPGIKLALKNFNISSLIIESEDKSMEIEGDINNVWNLNWKIAIKNTNKYLENLNGEINSTGKITGPLLRPNISAEITSDLLRYKKTSLANFNLQTAAELDILDRAMSINNFKISTKETGKWTLKSPTSISHHKKHYQFTAFCLDNANNHFCANGKWHENNQYEINFSGNKIPLDWIGSTINPDLIVNGQFDIKGKLSGDSTTIAEGQLALKLHPGQISYPIDLQMKTFPYNGGIITAKLSSKGLSGNLDIQFIEKSSLYGHIDIPEFYWLEPFGTEQNIDAEISWYFPSIRFLQPLISNTKDLDGALHINYFLNGTLSNPQLKGNATIDNASFTIPKLHTHYSNIQGDAIAKGKQIDYTLSAKVDSGDLLINGRTTLTKSLPSMFTLSGKNALISDNNGVKLYATPDLNLEIIENKISLQGKIHIPKATIKINDYSDTVTLPDEVVFINEEKKPAEPKWQVYSSIDLTLGDEINIDGMGLKASLGGELKITDTPEKTTVAHGILHVIEGSYKFYSTDLQITKGNLIFTGGPIYNPAVSVTAVRNFSGTQSTVLASPALTVGLNITGTLNKPEIQLFSSPERYNESDILSFLLLGQPLAQAGTDNANILLSAASAIDIGGKGKFSNVRNQVKNTLGLTEFDITSETEYVKKTNQTIQHTALVLGKYLSPKLYIKYSFDVLDHSNRVQLRYWLNKHWSIQTESRGPESSAVDFLYSIERK